MKHLLILLSFLLLSSTLFGQSKETGVLYQYKTSSGFVLKSFGDGKIQPKYKGEITNGKPDGFGVLTYPYDGKSIIGEWKNGKEWNTKHRKKDGEIIGKFENGEWELMWGVLYVGNRNGKWGYYKEKWVGEEDRGYNNDIGEYKGEVKNGEPNGQGTQTFSNGDKFVGEFKDGRKHGQGTYTWSIGDKFVGENKDGNSNGQGTITFSNGTKYVGEFKNGKRWNGTTYDKKGNILWKWVNGVEHY